MKLLFVVSGIVFWMLAAICIFGKCVAQEYTASARLDILTSTPGCQYPLKGIGSIQGQHYQFGKAKWAAMLVTCGAGFVDGVVEGFEFDGRRSFERKWGVEQYGFFGSMSHASEWTTWEKTKMSQSDFYHLADDVRKWGYISGGYMLGKAGRNNKRWVHDVFDVLIVGVASGIWKSAGMYYVREVNNF